ncbi:MAG TPA: ABC-F family ATP-binding cassette domain-containing protein [Chryseolinea sp.]|nr:ABC-F family ATP-binding cassette domain-containing protein [Chryseolinea sp.]
MLTLNGVSFTLPNGKRLLENITLSLNNHEKAALIGNNGVGKSTLLHVIAGDIQCQGTVVTQKPPYYVPQLYGQFDHITLAQGLRVDAKLHALKSILNGQATEHHFAVIDDDWSFEDRIMEAMDYWQLPRLDLDSPLRHLSGGQRTRIFLAGLMIHDPQFILLDEPTNHLDIASRRLLYEIIEQTPTTMLITSHDRTLLNLLNPVFELSFRGVKQYGGNYDFYSRQRQIEIDALAHDVRNKEKTLRKAKERARETMQRQQKLDARGKGKQEKAGLPTILQNTLKNRAEKSTAKINDVHEEKIAGIATELNGLREGLPDTSRMKLDIDHSALHVGKLLFEATGVNYQYVDPVWPTHLNVRIYSGERVSVKGKNGSGKTTLLRMILGNLNPSRGSVRRAEFKSLYIDQEYTLINTDLTVSEQAHQFNASHFEEHDINIRLNRFLFPKDTWQKRCGLLSGGERMRLLLCCLSIAHTAPDMIVLDEPTNNLDIQSAEILTSAINEYQGTLVVVTHDEQFLREVQVGRVIVV